jgi:hypothetical protein
MQSTGGLDDPQSRPELAHDENRPKIVNLLWRRTILTRLWLQALPGCEAIRYRWTGGL